jgi:hypothetical protein
MSRLARATFVQLLIGKSICEALVVTAVAAGLFLATTNPALHGWLDYADAQTISGWAVDDSNQGRRVEVQLFIDDKFVEQRTADELRPDVHQAKRADDDWHGFVFKTPPLAAGEHEAKVYVLHRGASLSRRTLQIIGNPIRFRNSPLQ